jgi:hypothetical protein
MMGTPNCTYTTVPVLETSSTFEMQFAREFKSHIGHGTMLHVQNAVFKSVGLNWCM